jgi:hypothetical protein
MRSARQRFDILQTVCSGLETVKKNILPQSRKRKEKEVRLLKIYSTSLTSRLNNSVGQE